MSTTSPNMNLTLPTVQVDSGLTWENAMNSNSGTLDQHNHAPGSGVQINPSGININTDLPLNNNNLTLSKSVRFQVQVTPLSGSPNFGCLYVSGVDLYYNDVSGNQVKITAGGGVNATSSGITNGTATASFVSNVLVVNSASNTPANIQGASILVGNPGVSGSKYVTLTAPGSLASNYSLGLPAIPASTAVVTLDTSGNLTGNTAYTTTLNQGIAPTGSLFPFSASSVPAGYLLCNGQAVSRTTYAALNSLYSADGYLWGAGDGSTTFNLPNMQGAFMRGAGTQTIGGKSRSATLGTAASDTTAVNGMHDTGHVHVLPPSGVASGGSTGASWNGGYVVINVTGNVTALPTLGATAQLAGDAETAPASIGMNYIVKT